MGHIVPVSAMVSAPAAPSLFKADPDIL
ncbi:hypothetical protein BM590_A1402 [Brucella melitensis M5-90]|nr:hypothetical protein BM590_A1402 [Brucella melitensis M5-90]